MMNFKIWMRYIAKRERARKEEPKLLVKFLSKREKEEDVVLDQIKSALYFEHKVVNQRFFA